MEEPGAPNQADLATQAVTFIKKAASVLEKEVAAGLVAAQSLEKRLVDVESIRNRPSDEVMQRFRGSAHEVVDLVMDLLAVGVQSADSISQRLIEIANADVERGEAAASATRQRKGRKRP